VERLIHTRPARKWSRGRGRSLVHRVRQRRPLFLQPSLCGGLPFLFQLDGQSWGRKKKTKKIRARLRGRLVSSGDGLGTFLAGTRKLVRRLSRISAHAGNGDSQKGRPVVHRGLRVCPETPLTLDAMLSRPSGRAQWGVCTRPTAPRRSSSRGVRTPRWFFDRQACGDEGRVLACSV